MLAILRPTLVTKLISLKQCLILKFALNISIKSRNLWSLALKHSSPKSIGSYKHYRFSQNLNLNKKPIRKTILIWAVYPVSTLHVVLLQYILYYATYLSPNVKRPIAHSAVVGKDKDIAETPTKWVKIVYERMC